jgi:class 3 adenylate cyclase
VRNLTVLFTDLRGSTRLYANIGDPSAFALVRDHFVVLQQVLQRRRGALVKTIGDAVMAVFPSSQDAVEAGLEIQREFTEGQIARGEPALRVKLGLHRGPCIAVNANDLLDYFGSTVNIAARAQNESLGGDLVVTPEVLADPGVQQVLARERPGITAFDCRLKGFTQAFTLTRLWVGGPNEAAEATAASPAHAV